MIISILTCTTLLAQEEKMYIHKSDKMTLGAPISLTDSIYFSEDQSMVWFKIGTTYTSYPESDIDSITFGSNSNTISINYNGNDVTVVNPRAFEGVNVNANGSDVTINATSGIQDLIYKLSGSTSNGTFKIYSDKRFYINLNGVNITNPDGPAINNQSTKKTFVVLMDGTNNILTDGVNYIDPPTGEEQDATFFSEGDLVFSGNGTLTINGHGNLQHGICSDDKIEINGGSITVASAAKDGIHSNDGILITAGTINVTSTGDGIDGDEAYLKITGGSVTTINHTADANGITCDSIMDISGGTVNVTVTGNESKGIKCNSPLTFTGGNINIHTSGDAVLIPSGSGFDPSYCTAIKSEKNIVLGGANIAITSSGKAGKGISSDTDIVMYAGTVNITCTGNGAVYTNPSGIPDAYVSTCFSTDGSFTIDGGSITTSSSGSGGKGFSTDALFNIGTLATIPTIQITTTGARILISGTGSTANYAEAKAIKSDGNITINKGNITISSADDGIKSETAITINDGIVNITNSKEGLEAPFITINGGNTHINSTDDSVNATFGSGGETNDGSLLKITAGRLVASTTNGDGLDSNGNILFTGGTTIVHGPLSSPEVGLDYNGTCNMNGGYLVLSGTNSNMLQAPGTTSAQYCLKIKANQSMSASTLFHIQNSTGTDILTFQPVRTYYSIIFSSSALINGSSYSIYTGGTCTGINVDGLYTGGTYTGGTFRKTFTISSKITSVTF